MESSKMSDWINTVMEKNLQIKKDLATDRSLLVLSFLNSKGIRAKVIGSLANGKFALHSDVDFLLIDCPKAFKYSIESHIEDIMQDIKFDVLYNDETTR